jgi:asparagine synthase (glutamine-hydrolysing)
MCGISGWFDTKECRPPNASLLKEMNDAIAHRGPDGDGFFLAPGIGLGHRRLAIIDLSTGDQPMASHDGSIQIVFNGEIYNFRELRQSLEAKGSHIPHPFRHRGHYSGVGRMGGRFHFTFARDVCLCALGQPRAKSISCS